MNGFFRTGNDSWRDTLPSLISKLIFHSPSSCHGHRALPWPNSPFLPDLLQDVGGFSSSIFSVSACDGGWPALWMGWKQGSRSSTGRLLGWLMQIIVKWPVQSAYLAVSIFEFGMAKREIFQRASQTSCLKIQWSTAGHNYNDWCPHFFQPHTASHGYTSFSKTISCSNSLQSFHSSLWLGEAIVFITEPPAEGHHVRDREREGKSVWDTIHEKIAVKKWCIFHMLYTACW